MTSGANEVLIRPFTMSPAGSDRARYRVLWDPQGTRFLVLSDTPPKATRGGRTEASRWTTGEYVIFFHDRETEASPPREGYQPEKWTSRLQGPEKGVVLPLFAVSPASFTGKSERIGTTGEMRRSLGNTARGERIQNFTIHSSTQRLRQTNSRPVSAFPPTQLNVLSPDRKFQARLMAGEPLVLDPVVVISEGEAFRDQMWVLLYPFRTVPPLAARTSGQTQRFVWSKDSRHLLLLTRESGLRGLSRAPSGEENYLTFDTASWAGVTAPDAKDLEGIDFEY
jgi:hypothetical protein